MRKIVFPLVIMGPVVLALWGERSQLTTVDVVAGALLCVALFGVLWLVKKGDQVARQRFAASQRAEEKDEETAD